MSRIWPLGLIGASVIAVGTTAAAQPLGLPGLVFPSSGSSQAPDPFLLNFDENGNATVSENGGSPTPLQGTLMVNVSNGAGFPLTLTYVLPEPVVTGTVSFAEPGEIGRAHV